MSPAAEKSKDSLERICNPFENGDFTDAGISLSESEGTNCSTDESTKLKRKNITLSAATIQGSKGDKPQELSDDKSEGGNNDCMLIPIEDLTLSPHDKRLYAPLPKIYHHKKLVIVFFFSIMTKT